MSRRISTRMLPDRMTITRQGEASVSNTGMPHRTAALVQQGVPCAIYRPSDTQRFADGGQQNSATLRIACQPQIDVRISDHITIADGRVFRVTMVNRPHGHHTEIDIETL